MPNGFRNRLQTPLITGNKFSAASCLDATELYQSQDEWHSGIYSYLYAPLGNPLHVERVANRFRSSATRPGTTATCSSCCCSSSDEFGVAVNISDDGVAGALRVGIGGSSQGEIARVASPDEVRKVQVSLRRRRPSSHNSIKGYLPLHYISVFLVPLLGFTLPTNGLFFSGISNPSFWREQLFAAWHTF